MFSVLFSAPGLTLPRLWALLVLAAMFSLAGCKKDNDTAAPANARPRVKITSTNRGSLTDYYVSHRAGTPLTDLVIDYKAEAPHQLQRVIADAIYEDGSSARLASHTSFADAKQFSSTLTFSVPGINTSIMKIRVRAEDKKNQVDSAIFLVNIIDESYARSEDVTKDQNGYTYYYGERKSGSGYWTTSYPEHLIDFAFKNTGNYKLRFIGADDVPGLTSADRANTRFAAFNPSAVFQYTSGEIYYLANPTANEVVADVGADVIFYNPNTGRRGVITSSMYNSVTSIQVVQNF